MCPRSQKKSSGGSRSPPSVRNSRIPCSLLMGGTYLPPRAPAIPHRLMEDDVYNGYFLPKDSIVLGNAWCVILTLRSPRLRHVPRWPHRSMPTFVNQGDPTRRQALPGSLHVQPGALHDARHGPARPGGGRLRVRLWAARLPRPLDGALLRLDRRRERALHVQNRQGRARRPRRRAHRRVHSRHPRVRLSRLIYFEQHSTKECFFLFFFSSYRSPEKFECSVKPRSKEAEALVRATATA